MRPEDITEQDENGKIKDTEGQLAADENRNETVETEVSQETHSEYKIPGKSESRVSYHLSGMYQDWFLDYAYQSGGKKIWNQDTDTGVMNTSK